MLRRRNAQRRRFAFTVGGAALSALGLTAPVAYAEDQAPSVDEVVVVATPLDPGTPLSRIPANAQTLTARDVARQNPTSLADLLNGNLGSVSVSGATGNPYQNDVNYRGFQATSVLGAPVGLAVYFDGVRANEPFGSIVNWDLIPTNAIASAQVQPGSNPVFGLNALGGAIVVNTRTGEDSPGVTISGLGGSFGRWAASVEAGGSDAGARTDYFLAANYDRQDGWRDHSGSEVRQLFGKVRWRPGARSLIELSGAWADTALKGPQALPVDMLSNPKGAYSWPDAIDNRLRLVDLKASHVVDEENRLTAQVYYRQSDAESLNSNAGLDDGCFDDGGGLAVLGSGAYKCANAAPGGTAVNAITDANALALGYGLWTGAINSSLIASTVGQDTVGGSAQWVNTTSIAGHGNTLALGAGFDQSNISFRQATSLARMIGYETVVIPNRAYGFTANGLQPSPANPPAFNGPNVLSSVALGSRMREANAYFTDTFDVTAKLRVTAALSYDYTSIDQAGANVQALNGDGSYTWTDPVTGAAYYSPAYVSAFRSSDRGAGAAPTPNGVPAGAVAGPEASSLNGSHQYGRFNPRLGFNYDLAPNLGLFGHYSESMRAPTSIELSCANPARPCALPTGFNGDPDLKAVTSRTFELGGRGRLGGRVSWNAALYDSRLQNDIQFIAASVSNGYFFNVGGTERRGFDLGAHVGVGRLALSVSYGYVEALYRSPFTTAAGARVRSGDRIPGIPAHALKLRAGYRISDALRIGGAVIVASDQYAHGAEDNSVPGGRVPGYAVVDLDAQYRIGRNLTLSLDVENLFDRKYATYGLSGITSIYSLATEPFRTPAAPRAVWLKVAYAFGGAEKLRDED